MEMFLQACKEEADLLNDSYVSLEHFLLAWSKTQTLPESIRSFFKHTNFNEKTIKSHMQTMRKGKGAKIKTLKGNTKS